MTVEAQIQTLTDAVSLLVTEATASIAASRAALAEAQAAVASLDIKIFPSKADAIAYSVSHPLAIVFSEEP